MGRAGSVGRGIGKTIKWAVLVGALLIIIVVVVAIFSLGSAASDSEDSAKEVTPTEYAAIREGQSIARVKAIIGAEPESSDETTVAGSTLQCIYYGVLASESSTYQFCFDDGLLTSKSKI